MTPINHFWFSHEEKWEKGSYLKKPSAADFNTYIFRIFRIVLQFPIHWLKQNFWFFFPIIFKMEICSHLICCWGKWFDFCICFCICQFYPCLCLCQLRIVGFSEHLLKSIESSREKRERMALHAWLKTTKGLSPLSRIIDRERAIEIFKWRNIRSVPKAKGLT